MVAAWGPQGTGYVIWKEEGWHYLPKSTVVDMVMMAWMIHFQPRQSVSLVRILCCWCFCFKGKKVHRQVWNPVSQSENQGGLTTDLRLVPGGEDWGWDCIRRRTIFSGNFLPCVSLSVYVLPSTLLRLPPKNPDIWKAREGATYFQVSRIASTLF